MNLSSSVGLLMVMYVSNFIDALAFVFCVVTWFISLFTSEWHSWYWLGWVGVTFVIGIILGLITAFLVGYSLTNLATTVGSNLQTIVVANEQKKT